jgi:hypothetical protein
MEEGVFFQPEVLREMKRYVEVRLHTDRATDASRALLETKKERLEGDVSSPIYEIVDPAGGRRIAVFRGADLGGSRFREFLEKNAAKKAD